jgi:methyl-accepting chemotaxis protein
MPEEEFEVIPLSPIRRLERRLDQMESGTSVQEINKLVDEVIELIKANQQIVDDLVKANLELRNEVARIPPKIDELLGTLNEFVSLLKSASQEEAPGTEAMKPIADNLAQLVEFNKKAVESNQAMINALDTIDKRLKRLYVVPPRPPANMNPMMRRTI